MTNVFSIVATYITYAPGFDNVVEICLGGLMVGGIVIGAVLLLLGLVSDHKLIHSDDVDKINERGCSVFPQVDNQRRWFKRAIELGDPVGYFNLGVCYREGCGVERDLQRAYNLFRRAAELGDPDAAFWCGDMWARQGEHEKAVAWFQRGQNVSYKCLLRLARAFEKGLGAPVKPQYAAILRQEAEEMKKSANDELDALLKRKINTKDGKRVFTYEVGYGDDQTKTCYYYIYEDF